MEIKHNKFFKIHYPIYLEDNDLSNAFLEEAYLYYGSQMTPGFKYDDKNRTAFDIVLLPISDVRYILNTVSNQNDRTIKLNEIIDNHFIDKLINITPIYKIDLLLDYHLAQFTGKKDDFYKHLQYVILPLAKTKIEKLQQGTDQASENLPSPTIIEDLVMKWMALKNPKKESKPYWTKIGVYISIIALIATVLIAILSNG